MFVVVVERDRSNAWAYQYNVGSNGCNSLCWMLTIWGSAYYFRQGRRHAGDFPPYYHYFLSVIP